MFQMTDPALCGWVNGTPRSHGALATGSARLAAGAGVRRAKGAFLRPRELEALGMALRGARDRAAAGRGRPIKTAALQSASAEGHLEVVRPCNDANSQ